MHVVRQPVLVLVFLLIVIFLTSYFTTKALFNHIFLHAYIDTYCATVLYSYYFVLVSYSRLKAKEKVCNEVLNMSELGDAMFVVADEQKLSISAVLA